MTRRKRRKLEILTNSRLKCYRACKRKHHLAYECGYRRNVEDEVLHFGTLVHAALEAWWRCTNETKLAVCTDCGVVVAQHTGEHEPFWFAFDQALAASFHAIAIEPNLFIAAKARAMMRGYEKKWRDENLVAIEVENEFFVPLLNPISGQPSRNWLLGGKLDVIAIHEGGQNESVTPIEHKTTSQDIRPGSTYWKRLRMDSQPAIYTTGISALGYDVEDLIYDVLKKPGCIPLKATPVENRKYTKDGNLYANQRDRDESPQEYEKRCTDLIMENLDEYFVRDSVPRLKRDLAENSSDIWAEAKIMRESELMERNPRNPDSCDLYNRECEFFEVCANGADIDDTTRWTRTENPHAELKNVPPPEEEIANDSATD